MPRSVSRTWLWQAQNAFLTETDPATTRKWADRHGYIRDSRGQYFGNVESKLSYGKLHRTGNLLRGLKVKYESGRIVLYNTVPYASEHQLGGATAGSKTLKSSSGRVMNASSVKLGGNVVARPFMTPSHLVLNAPQRAVRRKLKSLGW